MIVIIVKTVVSIRTQISCRKDENDRFNMNFYPNFINKYLIEKNPKKTKMVFFIL